MRKMMSWQAAHTWVRARTKLYFDTQIDNSNMTYCDYQWRTSQVISETEVSCGWRTWTSVTLVESA